MFKREMKVNFKSFITWLIVLVSIFLVVFLIYPSIIKSDNMKSLDDIMKVFPKEILIAFNMDISSISSAFGWLKSEGFVFILLITGCYSGMLGSNILLKEESDGTIEYLNSLPIGRKQILYSKVLPAVIYITLIILLLSAFNLLGLYFSGEFNLKQYLLLSITPLFSSLVIFFICLYISTFFHKTKKMFGISLGFVFISYILQILSGLSSNVEFLKYFSVFTLADIRNVINSSSINLTMVIITLVISACFLFLTKIHYEKKELIG